MGFFSFIGNTAETSELNTDVELRSRYYKTNYSKTKAVIIEYANDNKITVKHVDDQHKEVLLQGDRFHIIVSMVQVTPIETSVDLKVEQYSLLGLNRPKKRILALYEHLNQSLSLKGVSLHP